MLMACVSRPLTTCDAWHCVVDFCAVELLRRCFWQQICRTQLRGDDRNAVVVVHFIGGGGDGGGSCDDDETANSTAGELLNMAI